MSTTVDIDPTFKHALKLLHSGNIDSAEKIRNLLDELIKQRFGGSKTLINTLSKKHLDEERSAVGSNLYVRKQKPAPVVVAPPIAAFDSKQQSPANSLAATESAVPTPESLTVPPPAGSIILSISDVEGNDEDDEVVMEDEKLKELEDLMCIVCRRMDVSARNRLVECADCTSLYHQDCHKPVISEADANDQENAWLCTLCKGKSISKSSSSPSTIGSPAKISSSSHSKSSSSKSYESSSSSSRHKSSKSSKEGSSHERGERDRDRDRERDRDRSDRDRDRDRDRERDRSDRDRDREKSSKSSSSSSATSSSTAVAAGASSSSSGVAGTPSINIISADKRLQMMKKKAAKLHDSKRKHKY
ncbi:integrator complex subunit 12 [Wyeomyia smithii]|uniref:integrator complex subunit 12 n=1 Tax=Wyeomyia smithii TaxID=174621 RepID=UPI002467B649|nr:integrator complex subunit 12 [Wyeomyia smithii]